MSTTQKVPRQSDHGVVKISLQEICYDTWMAEVSDGNKLQLLQVDEDHVALKVNDQLTNIKFEIFEYTIRNLKLRRNGFCPADRHYVYYVADHAGKRFRHLYLYQRRFGTRRQLGLRYPVQCMSRRQRAIYKMQFDRRRARRKRARDRQWQRRLAAHKARMGAAEIPHNATTEEVASGYVPSRFMGVT